MGETRLAKDIQWLGPFLRLAKGLVPIHRIREIRTARTPLDKIEHSVATCGKLPGGFYRIVIKTHYQRQKAIGEGRFVHSGYARHSKLFVLDSLAHELAHVKHWEHTPQHLVLQSKLLLRFARELERQGFHSTEVDSRQVGDHVP